MRFRIHSTLVLTAVAAAALTAHRNWPMDGFTGILFSFGHDTVWADGYSDSKWRSLWLGMKREEVYAVVGPPLQVRQRRSEFDFDVPSHRLDEVVECWTMTANDNSYFVRQLVIRGEAVVAKSNYFYVD